VRRAVADAVLELFRDRRFSFSVAEVADAAGVHRGTVYRRWPTRVDLVGEALTVHTARLRAPDTGGWEGDVHALVAEFGKFFADPVEIGMNVSFAVGADPQVADATTRHWMPLLDAMAEPVRRAMARGEIAPDLDPMILLNMIIGPLLVRTVLQHLVPTDDYLRSLAETVCAATRR
jgi:AcrR family transcriptional regulator